MSPRVATAVVDAGAPHARVTVEQVRHAFGFGCIGFDLLGHANGEEDRSELAEAWLGVFDQATLPFYLGRFEPERGRPDTARLLATARWFADRGVRVKGHPLVWHTVKAAWMDSLPDAEAERALRERVRRETRDFRGLIGEWDAINEVVIMPHFENEPDGVRNAVTRLAERLGRVGIVRLALEEARAGDPSARYLVNDFDLSERYERLIEELIEAGIELDGIGLQTHQHQGFRGEERLLAIADRFARFGLPLHFTETSLVSGDLMPADIEDLNDYVVESWPTTPEGEARQADELVRQYRALTSHPAVESITYWGLTDEDAWLGAPIGLLRLDGSRKPSYDALHDLVRGEWWLPPTELMADGAGRVEVTGWRGDYALTRADGERLAFTIA
ncbi:MAG: endo-1,4-beta-xylanase [Microbacteriaceae bacterium]|nr:endo-1,4-beta-xylanase [Microbacteriaceae bacterium]